MNHVIAVELLRNLKNARTAMDLNTKSIESTIERILKSKETNSYYVTGKEPPLLELLDNEIKSKGFEYIFFDNKCSPLFSSFSDEKMAINWDELNCLSNAVGKPNQVGFRWKTINDNIYLYTTLFYRNFFDENITGLTIRTKIEKIIGETKKNLLRSNLKLAFKTKDQRFWLTNATTNAFIIVPPKTNIIERENQLNVLDTDYYYSKSILKDNSTFIYLLQSKKVIFDKILKMINYTLFSGSLLFLVGFALIVWFARRVIHPIKSLEENVLKIKEGDLKARSPEIGNDEITSLTISFNNMAESLEKVTKKNNESKIYINNIFSSLTEMLIVIDHNGIIKVVNKKVTDFLGFTESQLVGSPITKVYTGAEEEQDSSEGFYTHYFSNQKKSDTNNYAKEFETVFKTFNGDLVHVLISASLLDSLEGRSQGVIISAKDVRDSRLLKEIKEKQSQLVQSAKLVGLAEMAGGIAHEINNPLTIINSIALILEKKIKKNKFHENDALDATKKIKDVIIRITNIVQALKNVSRDGSKDDYQLSNILDVLNDSLSLCQEKFIKNGIEVTIENNTQDEVIEIVCQRVQLSQIFLNLLHNSFQAIQDNDEMWLKIVINDEKENIEIRFTDSGKGISEELRSKIFQPFFTTKEIGAGTGLGLSLVRTIIQQHNGEITIDGECVNTCFVIILPKTQKHEKKRTSDETP